MRSFGFRLTLFVAILGAGIGSTAWALGYPGDTIETVYVMPSSVTLATPTSYVVSTAWVEPTAYAVPTYYTTAYWMDPVVLAQPTYATTAYVRRGLFGRRWLVERPILATYATTYAPTAYYGAPRYRATSYPVVDRMVVPSRYVVSADCICPPTVAMAAPAERAPAASSSPGSAAPRTGSRSRSLQSDPEELSTIDSSVGPPPGDSQAAGASGSLRNNTARETIPGTLPDLPTGFRDNTPTPPPPQPAPPVSGSQPSTAPTQSKPATANTPGGQSTPVTPGAGGGGLGGAAAADPKARTTPNAGLNSGGASNPGVANPSNTVPAPTAPSDADPNAPPEIGPPGEVRRNSLRPSYGASAVRPEFRNILVGTVLSSEAREPEEGVRISVRNANSGGAKATTTNAFGRFAVRLADGDWTVNVTMPSGNVYEVSQIRVSNGLITDSLGRRVPSLEITR
jgi:hypothetical protein